MTTEENAVRRYAVGGLPHVELHGVEVSRCTKCGAEELAIPRIAQLHQVLAKAFVHQRRVLAPTEIRFLRKHMGLDTKAFAVRMGVARETVSRWESTKAPQPMGPLADRLLRLLVLGHEPVESYEVENLLDELDDEPASEPLDRVPLWNSTEKGWTPDDGSTAVCA